MSTIISQDAEGVEGGAPYGNHRELGTDRIGLSVNSISVLLRQEGLKRLDDERADLLRPEIGADEVRVEPVKHVHNPLLAASGLLDKPTRMDWLGGKPLVLRVP